MGYKEGELESLHLTLYDILSHVIETCDRLNIPYFIIGGSAIGAHFDGAILPWDDDIDIGMEGADYDRFLREAADALPSGYTLQSPLNEPHSPYYFAKVRKDNTLFISEDEAGLDIHHGIYVDIFPLDRCPDSPAMERFQRSVVRVLGNLFVAKEGKLTGSQGAVAIYEATAKLLPKGLIYKMLRATQSAFNRSDTKRVTIIRMDRDHIFRDRLHPPQQISFGGMMVNAPREILEYLRSHYEGLTRDVPPEQQINHAPLQLDFDTSTQPHPHPHPHNSTNRV